MLPATATAMPTDPLVRDFDIGFARADYCRKLRERYGVARKVPGCRFAGTDHLRNCISLCLAWFLRARVR